MDCGIGCGFPDCSARKFHGPKGTGFLYVHPTIRIDGMIVGGGQERNKGGTENVAGIVGLTRAFDIAHAHVDPRIAFGA